MWVGTGRGEVPRYVFIGTCAWHYISVLWDSSAVYVINTYSTTHMYMPGDHAYNEAVCLLLPSMCIWRFPQLLYYTGEPV